MTIGGLFMIDGVDVVVTLVPEEDVWQFAQRDRDKPRQCLAFVDKNVICTVNGWQRRQPRMHRRSTGSRSTMIAHAPSGNDGDGVDGPRLTTL